MVELKAFIAHNHDEVFLSRRIFLMTREKVAKYVRFSFLFRLFLLDSCCWFRLGLEEAVEGQADKDEDWARPLLSCQTVAKEYDREENCEELARCRDDRAQQGTVASDDGEDKMLAKGGADSKSGEPFETVGIALDEAEEA